MEQFYSNLNVGLNVVKHLIFQSEVCKIVKFFPTLGFLRGPPWGRGGRPPAPPPPPPPLVRDCLSSPFGTVAQLLRQSNAVNVRYGSLESQRVAGDVHRVRPLLVFHGLVVSSPRLVVGRVVHHDPGDFHVGNVGEHALRVVFPNRVLYTNKRSACGSLEHIYWISTIITYSKLWYH